MSRVQVDLSYTYTLGPGCPGGTFFLFTGPDSGSTFTFSDIEASPAPEPATFGSLLLGALGTLAARFRRRRSQA